MRGAQEVPLALKSSLRNALSDFFNIYLKQFLKFLGGRWKFCCPTAPHNDGCFFLKSNPIKGQTLKTERNLDIPGKPELLGGKGMNFISLPTQTFPDPHQGIQTLEMLWIEPTNSQTEL